MHRPGRVRRHRRPRRDPELVPVVGVALAAEDEGVVRVVVLLVADHDLELGPVLRDVLDDLVDALLELRVGGGRGRGGGWRGVERRRVHVGGVGRRREGDGMGARRSGEAAGAAGGASRAAGPAGAACRARRARTEGAARRRAAGGAGTAAAAAAPEGGSRTAVAAAAPARTPWPRPRSPGLAGP